VLSDKRFAAGIVSDCRDRPLTSVLDEPLYMSTLTVGHSSVRAIQNRAFHKRRQLRIVILNKELEEIGVRAFQNCTSLEEIVIPDAVRGIGGGGIPKLHEVDESDPRRWAGEDWGVGILE
jgi:hypothetical protein